MRPSSALLLAVLAVAALPAAKPLPPADDGPGDAARLAVEGWRGQGVSVCVGTLRAVPDFSPDDLEAICGCAFDRYLEGRGTAPLPPIEHGRLPATMQGQLLGCTARTRPERVSDVSRLPIYGTTPPPPPLVEPPTADAPKPLDDTAPADATSGESGGGLDGFWAWVGSLGLPAWLTGASLLWWIAIGILVFGLLVLKLRRRDPRNDLTGPPSAMRRGAPPQPPRRPDLPR